MEGEKPRKHALSLGIPTFVQGWLLIIICRKPMRS